AGRCRPPPRCARSSHRGSRTWRTPRSPPGSRLPGVPPRFVVWPRSCSRSRHPPREMFVRVHLHTPMSSPSPVSGDPMRQCRAELTHAGCGGSMSTTTQEKPAKTNPSLMRWPEERPEYESLRAAVQGETARWNSVGMAAGVIHGNETEIVVTGPTDIRTGAPITDDALFLVGSISKVYTATLV